MSQTVPEPTSSPKKFYFRFAMKNNFMNTNSTRFSEQFKKKIFARKSETPGNPHQNRPSLAKETDSRQIGSPPKLTPETNPETRRFKTFPRESSILHEYLQYRKRVQDKVNRDYKLMCKVVKLQALSKEISNKLQRQRKNLGLLRPSKKSTKLQVSGGESVHTDRNHKKNVASVQAQLEKMGPIQSMDQEDIEMKLTEALEKHVLKKKRTVHEEKDSDWRNSCPVDLIPQPLTLALKENLNNEGRFSVQNPGALDKALTKRRISGTFEKGRNPPELHSKGASEDTNGLQNRPGAEERRELGHWAKEKIKSFRNNYDVKMENILGVKKEHTPKMAHEKRRVQNLDVFQNLKTDKSEKKPKDLNFSRAKKSGSHLNSRKLVPHKKHPPPKNQSTKLYYRSGKALAQLPTSKPPKYSHKDKRQNSSHQNVLNLSKNISKVKREKEFWNRLGSGKMNSRMTRSFFLSKHVKSVAPGKPVKKTKSKKVIGLKSKSALKRDLFKKGSSSFGNLFSEFRANYKQYKKGGDMSHQVMISPCLSTKVIKKGRSKVFDSKTRTKLSRPNRKNDPRRDTNKKKPKNRRLPAISFRTMQEGKIYSKYPNGRENQLEEGLNAKMLKILSKMENLKETVKAEKQKLKFSGQKQKGGLTTGDFLKAHKRSSKKKERPHQSGQKGQRRDTSELMPNNLTFSGPQKLKQLSQLSNQKRRTHNEKENVEDEKRELKLTPMSEFSNRELKQVEQALTGTFKQRERSKPGMAQLKGPRGLITNSEAFVKTPKHFQSPDSRKPSKKTKKIKPLSRNSSKIRSLKKKTSKASKSFSNLNSKNLVPRVGKNFGRDKQRKMKNYLYDNNNFCSKMRNSNSIYNNRKTKKCYSLIGDSVRRFKYDKKETESQKLAGNRRRLRNLVRDKSLKLMQDYSNKNLTRKKNPVETREEAKADLNHVIEEKLRLLKTKLVHKSYEDSKKTHSLKTPVKNIISVTADKQMENFDSNMPVAPFNSITMREVTPRFKQDSTGKSALLKNSSILKKKSGNAFDSDYFESTGKKEDGKDSFALGEFIRKFDPSNVFNNEDMQNLEQGSLQVFRVQNVFVNKVGKIESIAKNTQLREKVIEHLRKKYTQIMNN